jgi:hypothetical protein
MNGVMIVTIEEERGIATSLVKTNAKYWPIVLARMISGSALHFPRTRRSAVPLGFALAPPVGWALVKGLPEVFAQM